MRSNELLYGLALIATSAITCPAALDALTVREEIVLRPQACNACGNASRPGNLLLGGTGISGLDDVPACTGAARRQTGGQTHQMRGLGV